MSTCFGHRAPSGGGGNYCFWCGDEERCIEETKRLQEEKDNRDVEEMSVFELRTEVKKLRKENKELKTKVIKR